MQKGVALLISLVLLTSLMSFVLADAVVTAETGNLEDSVIIQGQVIAIQPASTTTSTSTTTTTAVPTIVSSSSEVPATPVTGGLKVEVATVSGTKVLQVVSASGLTTTIGATPQTAITAAEQATGTKCTVFKNPVGSSTLPAGSPARIYRSSSGCIIVIGPGPTLVPANPNPSTKSPVPAATNPTSTTKPTLSSRPVYTVTVPVRRSLFRIFPTTIRSTVNVDVTTGKIVSVDDGLLVRMGIAQ